MCVTLCLLQPLIGGVSSWKWSKFRVCLCVCVCVWILCRPPLICNCCSVAPVSRRRRRHGVGHPRQQVCLGKVRFCSSHTGLWVLVSADRHCVTCLWPSLFNKRMYGHATTMVWAEEYRYASSTNRCVCCGFLVIITVPSLTSPTHPLAICSCCAQPPCGYPVPYSQRHAATNHVDYEVQVHELRGVGRACLCDHECANVVAHACRPRLLFHAHSLCPCAACRATTRGFTTGANGAGSARRSWTLSSGLFPTTPSLQFPRLRTALGTTCAPSACCSTTCVPTRTVGSRHLRVGSHPSLCVCVCVCLCLCVLPGLLEAA